jgi:23S rRNA (adenine2503-C2)-methyltransferase
MSETKLQKTTQPIPLIGMTAAEITAYVEANGFRAFHAKQIFTWVYKRRIESFAGMTDIPQELRKRIAADFILTYYSPLNSFRSADGATEKHVFGIEDGMGIEVVVLRDKNSRISFCISSQIGCAFGCAYCTTGALGFVRNLSAGEIVNQVLSLERLRGRPDSILFMGMGEPLANYNSVLKSIGILIEAGFSQRRITVSTCGIVKKIYDLAASGLRPRLAVSIGSVFEEKRKKIIPLSVDNSLVDLKKAITNYHEKTGRRVTLEYTLMEGINDTRDDAAALARFAGDVHAHVNIIRYNRSPLFRSQSPPPKTQSVELHNHTFQSPRTDTVTVFRQLLSASGVRVSERYRRGNDIAAACGQLVWHSLSEDDT